MLQFSTLYWGAAVFGQISLGLSVGACVCIGGGPSGAPAASDAMRQLVQDVRTFEITVLGVVPAQLQGAWPGGPATAPSGLRMIVFSADKCPVDVSRTWRAAGLRVVDLLIASEYWLALFSVCSTWSDDDVEKHVYRRLPALDARFLVQTGNDNGGDVQFRDALRAKSARCTWPDLPLRQAMCVLMGASAWSSTAQCAVWMAEAFFARGTCCASCQMAVLCTAAAQTRS